MLCACSVRHVCADMCPLYLFSSLSLSRALCLSLTQALCPFLHLQEEQSSRLRQRLQAVSVPTTGGRSVPGSELQQLDRCEACLLLKAASRAIFLATCMPLLATTHLLTALLDPFYRW